MSQTRIDSLPPELASNRRPGPPPALPAEAVGQYRALLWELNRWCRDQGASPQLNPWVAEEAIRQLWG